MIENRVRLEDRKRDRFGDIAKVAAVGAAGYGIHKYVKGAGGLKGVKDKLKGLYESGKKYVSGLTGKEGKAIEPVKVAPKQSAFPTKEKKIQIGGTKEKPEYRTEQRMVPSTPKDIKQYRKERARAEGKVMTPRVRSKPLPGAAPPPKMAGGGAIKRQEYINKQRAETEKTRKKWFKGGVKGNRPVGSFGPKQVRETLTGKKYTYNEYLSYLINLGETVIGKKLKSKGKWQYSPKRGLERVVTYE